MVEEKEKEGEVAKPKEEESSEGEFSQRSRKEPMIEEMTRLSLPTPYPQIGRAHV